MGITESFLVNTDTFDPIIEALIKKGKVPAKVNDELFAEMGFENPSDMLVIHILKGLKILEGDGTPTELFAKLVNPKTSRQAIAQGVVIGYKEMIKDNPHIYKADLADIREELGTIFKGKKTDLIIKYMSNTFQKLVSYAGLNNLDDARIEMLSGENATADIIKDVSEIHKNGTSPSNKISELRKEEKGDKGVDEILNSPADSEELQEEKAEEETEEATVEVEVEADAEAKAENITEAEIPPANTDAVQTEAEEETTEEKPKSSAPEKITGEEQEMEAPVETEEEEKEKEKEKVQKDELIGNNIESEDEEEEDSEELTLTFEGLVGLDKVEEEDEAVEEVTFHKNGKAEKVVDEHETSASDDSDEKTGRSGTESNATKTEELEAQLEEIQKDEARRNGSHSAASNKKSEPSMELTKQLTGKLKVQQAYLKKVDLLYKLERHEELLPTLEEIINHFDNSKDATLKEAVSKAVIRRAVVLGKLKRHDELVPALDEIIKRFSSSDNREYYEQASMAMLNKAQILENRDAGEELIPLYDDIVDRLEDTTNPKIREKVDKVFQKRVDLLMETGDNERLLPAVDELIDRFKDDKEAAAKLEEAMFKKAEILEQMDRDEDALQAYSEFLDKFGNKIEA